jgi:hypothetical protein
MTENDLLVAVNLAGSIETAVVHDEPTIGLVRAQPASNPQTAAASHQITRLSFAR